MFGEVPEDEWPLLQAAGRVRRFRAREVIWHEGDRADTVHVIRSGRLAIQTSTPYGEVASIAVLGPEETAGVIDMLSGELWHETRAIALVDTETIAIRSDALADLMHRTPHLEADLTRYLASRVIDLMHQLADALYVPAKLRVLRRLVVLARAYDPGEPIRVTQEDLSTLAGVTRPTVNRILQDMQSDGVLKLGRGAITVLDLVELETRAARDSELP
jgi:CRP-like cAMP-binding protein